MTNFSDRLRVAALPLNIAWADKAANLAAVEAAFERLPESTDVVVLPELFSTGFIDDPELMRDIAERNTGHTVDFLKELAARHSVAIAGSFLATTHPRFFNRGFFIEPSGEETFYDKRHLFSLSSEANVFARGMDTLPVVRFRGWNIALIVCYDLRFPAWCRNRMGAYDLLLVPANWPQSRAYAWQHLLIARAIENQCCVVGANRAGEDSYGVYDGLTYIFDGRGRPVGLIPDDCPFVVADLDRAEQEEFRKKFPAMRDADDFRILDREML
ncbi:MAG: nitrilase family protein [Bacteroidales bacterium]|nr:nitrilase family protein [Bacteroidales bacterium]